MTKDIEILLEILMYFQIILVSGILHEFGHYFIAKYYKLDPESLGFGSTLVPTILSSYLSVYEDREPEMGLMLPSKQEAQAIYGCEDVT